MIAFRHRHSAPIDLLAPAGVDGSLMVPVQLATADGVPLLQVEGATFLQHQPSSYAINLMRDPSCAHSAEAFWSAVEESARLRPDSPHGRLFADDAVAESCARITFDEDALRKWARTNPHVDPDVAAEAYVFRPTRGARLVC